jgi:nitroreductase
MQMAAVAQGYAGVWRTGHLAQDSMVKQAFNLSEQDEIVGFLYLGSSSIQPMPKLKKNSADFFEHWR